MGEESEFTFRELLQYIYIYMAIYSEIENWEIMLKMFFDVFCYFRKVLTRGNFSTWLFLLLSCLKGFCLCRSLLLTTEGFSERPPFVLLDYGMEIVA